MRLFVRPEARQELLAAQAWYEARSPGLGYEFARAVEAAIAQALRLPHAQPGIERGFRHVITRKFPYSIVYHASESEWVVVSCFHQSRKPRTWQTTPAKKSPGDT
jgi:Plasmid stabilisation system protein.